MTDRARPGLVALYDTSHSQETERVNSYNAELARGQWKKGSTFHKCISYTKTVHDRAQNRLNKAVAYS